MNSSYTLVRSNRKTLCISILPTCEVVIRSPKRMPLPEVERFVRSKQGWIDENLIIMGERQQNAPPPLTELEIDELKTRAKKIMPYLVERVAASVGLIPTGVKITSATKRWGSCSSKNNICFSYKIALLPDELIEYIIVHELCHIREKNHGKRFYALLEKHLPNYRDLERELKGFSR